MDLQPGCSSIIEQSECFCSKQIKTSIVKFACEEILFEINSFCLCRLSRNLSYKEHINKLFEQKFPNLSVIGIYLKLQCTYGRDMEWNTGSQFSYFVLASLLKLWKYDIYYEVLHFDG